jgi:AraC-like DNA-binding protein
MGHGESRQAHQRRGSRRTGVRGAPNARPPLSRGHRYHAASWLSAQRVAARRLLETTTAGIDQIAANAGFGSAATLRHHFQHVLGTSPTAYREQFRHAT